MRATYLRSVTRVEMYTTTSCPFCVRAKRLLQARGIAYVEHDVGDDPELRDEIVRRTGRRTVPQIFIDQKSIGGFEELAALDARGELAGLTTEANGD